MLGALKDFGKEAMSNIEKDTAMGPNTLDLQNQIGKCETSETCAEKWTEDFLKQTADQFEKNLQNLLQNGEFNIQRIYIYYYQNVLLGDNELEAALQKLGETSTNDATDEKDNISADFQTAISQVLKDLTTNSENLQVF